MSDTRPQFHDIDMEKGVLESVEDSMIPLGFAKVMTNYLPEPTGNLRVRTGWKDASETGAPATRKTRGVGFLSTQSLYMTPARVQYATGSGTGVNASATATWPAATTAGNLLVLRIAVRPGSGLAGSGVTLGATGWTLAKRQDGGAATDSAVVAIYYKENADAESGDVTVTTNTVAGNPGVKIVIAEYSGIATASSLDETAGDYAGSDTAVTSGTTATTVQDIELAVAVLAGTGTAATFGSETNDFEEVFEFSAVTCSAAVYDKVLSEAGAIEVAATLSGSNLAGGAIATFKAAPVTTDATVGFTLAANQNSDFEYGIYYIPTDDFDSGGTWTSGDTITVDTTSPLVDFAAGLGSILYTSPFFATLRKWSGGSGSALSGTPPGRAIAFHLNRFFVAGSNAHPSRLWYSAIGDETKFWDTDNAETSLTDSTFYEDIEKDDGENIEDIAVFSGGLLIAKRTSLHFLSGRTVDQFSIDPLIPGGGFAGRCICTTPYGAVVAGRDNVFLVTGTSPEVISKPIESSYGITGDFVSTGYVDGSVFICDEGTGTMYVFDIISGTWHIETVNSATEGPAMVHARMSRLYYGPAAATSTSPLAYRDFPQSRTRDANVSQVMQFKTPELVLASPDERVSPVALHFQIRQHGVGDTGLTITPYFDGTAGTPQTIEPKDAAGVFTKTLTIRNGPVGTAITTFQVQGDQTVPDDEESSMDIEGMTLEVQIERPRHG